MSSKRSLLNVTTAVVLVLTVLLFADSKAFSRNEAADKISDTAKTEKTASDDSLMGMKPVASAEAPDFTTELFWAYGLTCVALFAFTMWTIIQAKNLGRRAEYLRERFDRAEAQKD